jgi:crotonobetainyl-CoA:carnitine CoA-transferase CaiB-like acyl-CoA transferase
VPRPLSDLRIVAVEQYAAGPYGSLQLADLGADVIKVEPLDGGDTGRQVPPYRVAGDSLFFQSLNRNKRSVAIDLATADGLAVLRDLIANSDAVYSNLRGDVPEKLGLTYRQLRDVNPCIVCCSISGYGTTGPRANEAGYDYMVQARAGWMSISGAPGSVPAKTGLSVVDFATGLAAAAALLAGVHAARRDGIGCDCDVSLFETALSMLNYQATWHLSAGFAPAPTARSSHPTLVPFGMFPTADGWIVAGGSKEKFWRRLAGALGRADLVSDPRFETFDARLQHKDELIAELDTAFMFRTTAQWVLALTEAQVPAAPVNTVADALRDEQARARNAVFHIDHPHFGRIGHVASAVRAGPPREQHRCAPALGRDTRSVLSGVAGYSQDRIDTLIRRGVVAADFRPSPETALP